MDSHIKMVKLLPQAGSGDITLTTASQTSSFEIPASSCFRLDQTELSYLFSIPASAAGKMNWTYMKTIPTISRLELYNRQGQRLADIEDFNYYMSSVYGAYNSLEDLLGREDITPTATAGERGTYLNPSNALTADAGARRPDGAATGDKRAYTGLKYCNVNPTAADVLAMNIRFPLGDIVGSFFAVQEHLYTGQPLIIRITWLPKSYTGWFSTSATDPTAGTATALAVAPVISALNLYLATERNLSLCNAVMDRFNKGHDIIFEDNRMYKLSLSTTSQSAILRLNRSNGLALKRIMTTVWGNAEAINTVYDRTNINGAKVSNYYVMINNSRETDENISCLITALDDFQLVKGKLLNSAIQDSDQFQYNWFHLSDFSGTGKNKPLWLMAKEDQNKIQGMALDTEQEYQFVATTANATYVHRYFVCCARSVKISPLGLEVL